MSYAARPVARGPWKLFDGSMVVEFLEMLPEDDGDALIRVTFKADHVLLRKGKDHPLTPPLHVHFQQTETFTVLQGVFAVAVGYDEREVLLTPETTPYAIEPMVPHAPYVKAGQTGAGVDTIIIMRSSPHTEVEPLDSLFFEHLFRHLDEAWRLQKAPDVLQLMTSSHATASANVMLPWLGILGPLRWWLPWKMQAAGAFVGSLLGYRPAIAKFLHSD